MKGSLFTKILLLIEEEWEKGRSEETRRGRSGRHGTRGHVTHPQMIPDEVSKLFSPRAVGDDVVVIEENSMDVETAQFSPTLSWMLRD